MKERIDFLFEVLTAIFGEDNAVYAFLAIAIAWTVVLPIAFGVIGSFAAGCVVFCVNWVAYVYVCCRYYKECNEAC